MSAVINELICELTLAFSGVIIRPSVSISYPILRKKPNCVLFELGFTFSLCRYLRSNILSQILNKLRNIGVNFQQADSFFLIISFFFRQRPLIKQKLFCGKQMKCYPIFAFYHRKTLPAWRRHLSWRKSHVNYGNDTSKAEFACY